MSGDRRFLEVVDEAVSLVIFCAILGFKCFGESEQWNAVVAIPISRFSSRSDAFVVLNSWLYMP